MTEIIKGNDNPLLTTIVPEFDFTNSPDDPNVIALELMKIMNENNGIGLAANQIGKMHRVFVMRGDPENLVCFNPRIVHMEEEQILLEEGCLSYPNLLVKIKRPKKIRVRFQTPTGNVVTKVFDGLTARVFQHEIDHLNGILFYNKANRIHREQAFKKMEKLNGKKRIK
jgi:peptide deformylase